MVNFLTKIALPSNLFSIMKNLAPQTFSNRIVQVQLGKCLHFTAGVRITWQESRSNHLGPTWHMFAFCCRGTHNLARHEPNPSCQPIKGCQPAKGPESGMGRFGAAPKKVSRINLAAKEFSNRIARNGLLLVKNMFPAQTDLVIWKKLLIGFLGYITYMFPK